MTGERLVGMYEDHDRGPGNFVLRFPDVAAENAQLREALDLLRPAHHTPYEDEDHQGSNCVDLIMTLLARAYRQEPAFRALREWCDRSESAARNEPLDRDDPAVFEARMQLIDEVRSLLSPTGEGQ